MKIYLDHNIMAYIGEGELAVEDILRNIDNKINRASVLFPFSPAHIEETNNIKDSKKESREVLLSNRLQTIRDITDGCYIHYGKVRNELVWEVKEPKYILEKHTSSSNTEEMMNTFANLVTKDQKKDIERMLGFQPRELNNLPASEIIEYMDKRLVSEGYYPLLYSIDKLISNIHQGEGVGFAERIVVLFGLLDVFGFHRDKHEENSNYAGFWDANHVNYARHCNYFISNDRRTRKKAQVVYELWKLKTKVLDSNGEP